MSHCPTCDQPLPWGGMHYVPHTEGQHRTRRAILMRTIRRLLTEELAYRHDAFELALTRQSVLIIWHIKSVLIIWHINLPTDTGYYRTEVPGELWDAMDHDQLLSILGQRAKDWVQFTKGTRPHHMQVTYRVFDERNR